MSYHYGYPPPHYTTYSPHSSDEYVHYVPPSYNTPSKGHARKASYQPSPHVGGWYSPVGRSPHRTERFFHDGTPTKSVHVSTERTSSYTIPAKTSPRKRTQIPSFYDDEDVDVKAQMTSRGPRETTRSRHSKKPSTDSYFYFDQDQIHQETKRHSRSRSHQMPTSKSTTPKKTQTAVPSRAASQEDCLAWNIPKGYNTSKWEPDERPIMLLGSVFDAHSIGRWIYDWTVHFCDGEAHAPMAEMAGDLWLLLIKLAGKLKRAEDLLDHNRIRQPDHRQIMADFLASGDRLMQTFQRLLRKCEVHMSQAAKHAGDRQMKGKQAGLEFVASIFGRDRYLEETEIFTNNLRMWTMRFDIDCEEMRQRPTSRRGR